MGLTRRRALGLGVGSALALGLLPDRLAAATDFPRVVHPRDAWGRGLSPTRSMPTEAPGDVKFLLIHHSESPNTERPGSIPQRLRSFYQFHTGEKGWADVAYNFFVDPFGEIWEGRAGSLDGPVQGDATGGSQGYAQLCCFVGDHSASIPTDAAMSAMTRLLAWLAGRYAIDLTVGHSITFVSRGSNLWPKGAKVTTDPIAGHRDMSQTECPGNALYPLVRSRLLPGAQRLTSTVSPTSQVPPASPSAYATVTAAETASAPTSASAPAAAQPSSNSTPIPPLGVAGVAVGGTVAAATWALRGRRGRQSGE